MKKNYLFTPGPTMVPPECLQAMSMPMTHHRTAEYRSLFSALRENLKYVFQTKNEVLVFSSSGTGAMEAGVCNLLSKGDRCIVVRGGKFGERFFDIAAGYGAVPVPVDVEWGRAVKPEQIEKKLTGEVRAVYVGLCETSTGVANDVKSIASLLKGTGACLVVDAISGLGSMELKTDEWGVDVVVSGSQKGLMAPPGLSFICLNGKAWELAEKSDLPKYYFDIKKAVKAQEKSDSAFTPAITLVKGLNESLKLIRNEGLENVIRRHGMLAEATRAAMRALGLKLFAESPADSVTAVMVPPGVDGDGLVKGLQEKGVYIAGGQDGLKGKIFRLSHMGYINEFDVLQMISAVEMGLRQSGYDCRFGKGVGAAGEVFAGAGFSKGGGREQ